MSRRKRRIRPVLPVAERGGLILPSRYAQPQTEERFGHCSTCDRVFYRGEEQEWQKHVYKCAMENLDEILAARAEQKKRLAIFHESHNPDVEEHLAKVGRQMLREGRMVMRKNERIFNE